MGLNDSSDRQSNPLRFSVSRICQPRKSHPGCATSPTVHRLGNDNVNQGGRGKVACEITQGAVRRSVASRGHQTAAANPCFDATRKCDMHRRTGMNVRPTGASVMSFGRPIPEIGLTLGAASADTDGVRVPTFAPCLQSHPPVSEIRLRRSFRCVVGCSRY